MYPPSPFSPQLLPLSQRLTKLRHIAALSSTTPLDRSVECVKGPSWSVVFPRGYIAGRSLSKPVVLNLDNNAWVKSNSAGNFTEIYRQSLRGNTRLSKYGYKSNLSNSMTRRSEQRELSHKIDLIPPNINVSIESKKIPITAFPPDYSRQPFFLLFSPRDPLEIPHCTMFRSGQSRNLGYARDKTSWVVRASRPFARWIYTPNEHVLFKRLPTGSQGASPNAHLSCLLK